MERVIYEDAHIIVVYKPGNVPVQTSRLMQKDMVSILKNHRAKNGEDTYIGVIHRLDQPVEGVLVFAKTKEASAELGRQFQEGRTEKYYRAVVYNRKDEPLSKGAGGTLTDYLLKDGRTNQSKAVAAGIKGAKKAVLHYTVRRANESFAEIFIRLETGRHHQIRVQMANAGIPLLGDCKYGREDAQNFWEAGRRIALCAEKLSFIHPKTRKKMEFEIEPENPAFQIF